MNNLIFVESFLRNTRSSEILLDRRSKLNRRSKALSRGEQLFVEALFDGFWVLKEDSEKALWDLVQLGQLLYAWDGTRVLDDRKAGAA